MLVLSTFEDWALAMIRGLGQDFKIVDRIALYEVSEDNLQEFAKIIPACLLGVTDDDVVEDIDNRGTVRLVDYTLIVNVVTQGMWKKTDASDKSQTYERAIISALAGQLYTITDGSTEQTTCLRYRGTSTIRIEGGILIRPQRYALRVQEAET